MLQRLLQLISLLCCSEVKQVSMCVWERERERRREGERDRETACASTRDLLHSRLRSLCSVPLPFLSLPFLLVVFFTFFPLFFYFSLLCPSLLPFFPLPPLLFPPLILSPAVLPPFVPALQAEDDTSNFEELEQATPRPASAAQRGAPPVGFQGQDLPFLGWFFSRALTTLAKTEWVLVVY